MQYLITEIALCLLLAFVLGCLVGWLLKRVGSRRAEAALNDEIVQLRSELAPTSTRALPETVASTVAAAAATEPSVAQLSPATNTKSAGDPADLESSYDVEEIEGISSAFGERLRAMGVETTLDLINRCGDSSQLGTIAEQVGIEQFVIQKWLCMADLLRVPGVRGPAADLLAYAGVQSVADLASQKPATLAKELANSNNQPQGLPELETLHDWIAAAGRL